MFPPENIDNSPPSPGLRRISPFWDCFGKSQPYCFFSFGGGSVFFSFLLLLPSRNPRILNLLTHPIPFFPGFRFFSTNLQPCNPTESCFCVPSISPPTIFFLLTTQSSRTPDPLPQSRCSSPPNPAILQFLNKNRNPAILQSCTLKQLK